MLIILGSFLRPQSSSGRTARFRCCFHWERTDFQICLLGRARSRPSQMGPHQKGRLCASVMRDITSSMCCNLLLYGCRTGQGTVYVLCDCIVINWRPYVLYRMHCTENTVDLRRRPVLRQIFFENLLKTYHLSLLQWHFWISVTCDEISAMYRFLS